MKTQIDVISGYFESGKTTLINKVLKSGVYKNECVVILQCELGVEQIARDTFQYSNFIVVKINSKGELTRGLFLEINRKYSPSRIIIEYNGTWEISDLLSIRLPSGFCIRLVVNLVDGSKFALYIRNMGHIVSEPIFNSDIVFINRWEKLRADQIEQEKQNINNINKRARLYFLKRHDENVLIHQTFAASGKDSFNNFFGVMTGIMLLIIGYLCWSISQMPGSENIYTVMQTVNTIFIGILLQAVPFILIGIFVSSILQVFISEDKLVRIFSNKRGFAFPISAFFGILLPVCDCAMVPIASGMARKGVPVRYAITFLLAAPAVNPVVISSTLYAFPGQPEIAVYRILLGLGIALTVGLVLGTMPSLDRMVHKDYLGVQACSSGYLDYYPAPGLRGKMAALFRHASLEFLNVGRFVVVGAFISTLLQVMMPKAAFATAGGEAVSYMVMIAAAFLMSVCSTSNAFIARSLLNSFPLMGVLGFMVLGPMLDFKNLLMLSGNFKKRFVFILVSVILCVSSMLLYMITQAVGGS
jgi:Predicted permeases